MYRRANLPRKLTNPSPVRSISLTNKNHSLKKPKARIVNYWNLTSNDLIRPQIFCLNMENFFQSKQTFDRKFVRIDLFCYILTSSLKTRSNKVTRLEVKNWPLKVLTPRFLSNFGPEGYFDSWFWEILVNPDLLSMKVGSADFE